MTNKSHDLNMKKNNKNKLLDKNTSYYFPNDGLIGRIIIIGPSFKK